MKQAVMLAVAALFLSVLSASAGEEKVVNLQEALQIAMENNHDIRAFGHSVSAQQEDIGIARSSLLPKITFEERFMRTTNPTYAFMAKLNQGRFTQQDFDISSLNSPQAINDFQTSFSFEQPIFARKAYVGLDIAKAEFAAKNDEYTRKRQEIVLKVARAYLMVRTSREYVAVSRKAVEDAREHRRLAELRYNNGLGLYSDILRTSTALTDAEQKLVTAQKNFDVAKRALGLLLGSTEPVETASEQLGIPLLDIEYYTGASQERKDIKSLESRYENAKNGLRFAESGYFPVVGIGGSYLLNDHRRPLGAEGESWQFVAFLRWDLFDGTKREHERAKAKYQMAETEEHLNSLRKAVSFKVFEAYLTAKETMKNAELSRSALTTAEEGKRLVRVRYENSLSPIIDLLDSQLSLDHTRANTVARENEALSAIMDLAYESGTILKDLGMER